MTGTFQRLIVFALVALLAGPAWALWGPRRGGNTGAPPSTCPQGVGFGDGCAGAQATGSVQHSNFFTNYVVTDGSTGPTFINYGSHRPPWNVAGVDYPVGYSGSLTQAVTAGGGAGNLPACASVSSVAASAEPAAWLIHVTSLPCTFDHLDFSTSDRGPVCVLINTGLSGSVTFTNDHFDMNPNGNACGLGEIESVSPGSTLTVVVKYCEFDMTNAVAYPAHGQFSLDGPFNAFIYLETTGTSSVTLQYNAFLSCPDTCAEVNSLSGSYSVTSQYNYTQDIGGSGCNSDAACSVPAVHAEWQDFLGGVLTQWNAAYNAIYISPASCCGTTINYFTPQGGSAALAISDHEVLIERPYGTYHPVSHIIEAFPQSGPITQVNLTNDYIDPATGASGGATPIIYNSGGNDPGSTVCNGNINLSTGAALTGTLSGDSAWNCS